MQKPLLVGECNPYSADPEDHRYDLYPWPERASGARLCKILRIDHRDYLRSFDRVNLSNGEWSLARAKAAAEAILEESEDGRHVVLLGAKVCRAFFTDFAPFVTSRVERGGRAWYRTILGHPSGLCRLWNDPANVARGRAVVLNGVLGRC